MSPVVGTKAGIDDPTIGSGFDGFLDWWLDCQLPEAGRFRVDWVEAEYRFRLVSKAFTRESDDSGDEGIPIARRQLPPGTKNYITRGGADRLRERLLRLVERKQSLAERSREANAGMEADRRKIEAAIRSLEAALNSVVIAEPPGDRTKVAFGATVTIRHGDGEEERYRIVGIEEAEPERGSISWMSPLARVVLSRKAGERVRFREAELTVVSVEY